MSQVERNVLIDESTYYDLRDLSDEIEDELDVPQQENTEGEVALLERAAGILRELVWKYEESQSVEANSQDN